MNAVPIIGPAIADVFAERRRQATAFGHDADTDDRKPRAHLLREAHVRLLDACDLVTGRPDAATLRRARRKVVKAAALALAEIDRIDRQIAASFTQSEGLQ